MNNQSRRKFIRHTTLASALAIVKPSIGFSILNKGKKPEELIVGHGSHRYKVDKDWAKISVASNPLQNCHEMVQDHKGRLIMLGDNTQNNILIFDKSGKLLDFWGHAFPGGHGLTLPRKAQRIFCYSPTAAIFRTEQEN